MLIFLISLRPPRDPCSGAVAGTQLCSCAVRWRGGGTQLCRRARPLGLRMAYGVPYPNLFSLTLLLMIAFIILRILRQFSQEWLLRPRRRQGATTPTVRILSNSLQQASKTASEAPRYLQEAPRRPKIPQDNPRRPQDAPPKTPQDVLLVDIGRRNGNRILKQFAVEIA